MKKLLKLLIPFAIYGGINAQVNNFTITNNSGTSILTCSQNSIVLTASTTVIGPNSFYWTGPSFTITAPTVTITQAGTYTVVALDSLNNPFGTLQISIVSNTFAPFSAVSPASQTIACNASGGATVTSNATGNVTHTFVSPYGISVVTSSSVADYVALGPGTYTHILLDNTNGCQSSSTFSLTSSQSFPTFSVTSPNAYTLGCASKSIATIYIINAATSPTPGGPISYTLKPFSILNPVPPGTLSGVSTYTGISTPGLYYAIVKDNTSGCTTQIPVSIISKTSTPNISANIPTQILDCNTSEVTLQGNSSTNNVTLSWAFLGTPGIINSSSVTVITNTIVPTLTLVNTFTFAVTDNNNSCKSESIIPMYQNIFPPNALISSGGNTVISCETPTIALTNVSTTGITNSTVFPSNQPVAVLLWTAPNPLTSLANSSSYIASIAGVYTMSVKDLNNGCTTGTSIAISGDCNLVGLQKNNISGPTIKAFPNPAKSMFTILTNAMYENAEIEIYNTLGMRIKKQAVNSLETVINISEQPHGVYIIRLIKKDNFSIDTLRIVKE